MTENAVLRNDLEQKIMLHKTRLAFLSQDVKMVDERYQYLSRQTLKEMKILAELKAKWEDYFKGGVPDGQM